MSNAPAVRDQELAAARGDPKAILLDILRDVRVSLEQGERTYFAAVVSLDLFDQSSNHGVLAWIGRAKVLKPFVRVCSVAEGDFNVRQRIAPSGYVTG